MADVKQGAPAPAAPAVGYLSRRNQKSFGILYGESGFGKSTSTIFAFPRGFFVGPRNGIEGPAFSVCGWVPTNDDALFEARTINRAVYNITDLMELVPQVKAAGFDAIVVDDVSVLGERELRGLKGGNGTNNAYKPFELVANRFFELRDLLRDVGLHCVLSAHQMPPWQEEGVRLRGGPKLPGRLTPKHFPPVCDYCYRVEVLGAAMGVPGLGGLGLPGAAPAAPSTAVWPAVFRTNDPQNPDWYVKDRLDAPNLCPANLGEVLRNAGYEIARVPGLEWQEEMVETLARYVLAGNDEGQVLAWGYAQSAARLAAVPEMHRAKINYWTASDVRARVYLRRKAAERSLSLGIGAPAAAPVAPAGRTL